MTLKKVSAFAVCSLLCAQIVQAKNTPLDFLSDSTALASNNIDEQLNLIADSINFVHFDEALIAPPSIHFVPASVEGRLAYIQKDVPLPYNAQVQAYINTYSSDRYRNHLSRMMGLGQYYFPIYERVFAETGLPKEIKYLSIVESALNPHAVSRVGATGPWQFMFATARMYDLNMDNYMDERKDPLAASYAASAYLKDAYNDFGDWLMAIASYNCGKGNVLKAIRRSGLANPDYWDISPFLPRETRNYVPAFIAMTYMLEYHEEHGIAPLETGVTLETEIVSVEKFVRFSGVAQALEIDVDVIRTLNPAYKRDVVNGTVLSPKKLVLPVVQPAAYSALYAALNNPVQNSATVAYASNSDSKAITHHVRKGETLGKIALKYLVTVQDLRAWNNIKQHTIVPGQRLKIAAPAQSTPSKGQTKASQTYLTYRVKSGDTLSEIAKKHKGSTVGKLKAANGLKSNTIKPGMELKIVRN